MDNVNGLLSGLIVSFISEHGNPSYKCNITYALLCLIYTCMNTITELVLIYIIFHKLYYYTKLQNKQCTTCILCPNYLNNNIISRIIPNDSSYRVYII